MHLPLKDRREGGRLLAGLLTGLSHRDDILVLGLPRGGVPVAYEVAIALDAPLDVCIVRKLGVPGHEELAMGAIASGNVLVRNEELIADIGISEDAIAAVAAHERRELARRERLYRGTRPMPEIAGETVVLVDDGLATGSTMLAAVRAMRALEASQVVVAVPIASPEACRNLEPYADRIACAETPASFYALGLWYEDFAPTSDAEVQILLATAASRPALLEAASPGSPDLLTTLSTSAHPLTGDPGDHDVLIAAIDDARLVLIGEASHGTHEFYATRVDITRRLIEAHAFDAVAVEADWPDAFRLNRYVRGASDDATAEAALGSFQRFPQWMWRNTVMREFIDWLAEHNRGQQPGNQAGFYGLDLYSLHASIDAVIRYLDTVDPEAARRARARYGCFDQFSDDAHGYGHAVSLGWAESCEDDVVNQLVELQRRATDLASRDGRLAGDEFFSAEQNARLARNAEAYYRSMFRGRVSSWNLRDTHMADTLDALRDHLEARNGRPARIVVWAHNSHLGDARATQMGAAGELNLGQLARERHGDAAYLIGQTTWGGTVTAASNWDEPAQRMEVRPGMRGSVEALFHDVAHDAFLLFPGEARSLREPRLERAIGVIYRPDTERLSHYFDARLADQFDAVLHHDLTTALEPLAPLAERQDDLAETWPFAGAALPGNRPA